MPRTPEPADHGFEPQGERETAVTRMDPTDLGLLEAIEVDAPAGTRRSKLGVGAWLATSAAIAAGIYELTGSVFYGIGSVALANLAGVGIVLVMMRTCWRDVGLPRTRRMLHRVGHSTT